MAIFHVDDYDWQNSQITEKWNKKPLTRSKERLESLSLKLLCDVNLP